MKTTRLSVSVGGPELSRETLRLLAAASGAKSRELSERKWGEEVVALWSSKRAFGWVFASLSTAEPNPASHSLDFASSSPLATRVSPGFSVREWWQSFCAGLRGAAPSTSPWAESRVACRQFASAGMSHEERPKFYRQEVNKTIWEVPERYQNLSPVGSGAYGSVW